MKKKQLIAFASAMALAVTSLAGCGKSEGSTQKEAVSEAEGTAKEDLPLSKYPETVTVHLGGSLNPNAKLPDGMAYDDNPYIDFLKEDLNIEVVYDWVASSTDYEEKMNLCIGSNTVPELMNVNATQYRALLKYDMIQPLDEYFDDYASDALKSYVKSGGEELQKCITNEDGEMMAAETAEEALKLAQEKTGNTNLKMEDLRQDDDCLDTWFSSWLWPISLFNGINNPNNEEINYYYPTSDLVTGPDIIFFWVARMIMAGYEYKGDMPFKNVYFTGIVRDKLGRKMSKSLGNSPDPLELIDKYGADGVRMGMMLAAPAGNDILFDDALCEQGRNFNNKIWNAFRLVKGWEVADIAQPEYARLATEWFESMLAKTAAEVADLFGKYRLSEALMAVYKLFWDEFSSWYLEMIKPAYGQPIDKATYEKTLGFFDNLLKLLHPFMPFITEELWQHIYDRKEGESLMVQQLNIPTACNEIIVKEFEAVKEVIGGIRTIRLQKNIAQKETLELQVVGENPVAAFNPVITKLCNLSSIEAVENKADGSGSFMVGTTEYAIPLGNLINTEEELAKLEADLKYQEGFLQSVLKKLSNEKFVSKAPANVIDMERKKQADAESKIASLKESIAALKK